MDAKEQLLLSEGVCRQLGIVTYHREVVPGKGEAGGDGAGGEVYVPTVRVTLVKTIKLRPAESAVVDVRVVGDGVGGLGERSVGGGVGGSELLTDSCSRQVCAGPPQMLLETSYKWKRESRYQTP